MRAQLHTPVPTGCQRTALLAAWTMFWLGLTIPPHSASCLRLLYRAYRPTLLDAAQATLARRTRGMDGDAPRRGAGRCCITRPGDYL